MESKNASSSSKRKGLFFVGDSTMSYGIGTDSAAQFFACLKFKPL